MKQIHLTEYLTTELKPGSYPNTPIGEMINFPVEIYGPCGGLLASYMKAPEPIYRLAKEISLNTKPQKSARTRIGVPQLSTVYGVLPRIPIREDYCRFSKQTKAEALNAEKAYKLNVMVAKIYKQLYPQKYNAAVETVRSTILKDYRLVDTPWTNVNINLNQVIKYHRDRGNVKEDFSNVLIIKNGVEGGHLACPELGVTFAQDDGYMIFFEGQKVLHGVTPCTFKGKNSFRSSIVMYSMEKLRHCYPYELEMARLKERKTKQAKNRKANFEKLEKFLAKMKKEN